MGACPCQGRRKSKYLGGAAALALSLTATLLNLRNFRAPLIPPSSGDPACYPKLKAAPIPPTLKMALHVSLCMNATYNRSLLPNW